MPKFMYVFRGGGYATPDALSPTELQQHLAQWNAWTEKLRASGRLASASALAYPPSGKTVSFRGTTWMRCENGKLLEGYDTWNRDGLMRELGAG